MLDLKIRDGAVYLKFLSARRRSGDTSEYNIDLIPVVSVQEDPALDRRSSRRAYAVVMAGIPLAVYELQRDHEGILRNGLLAVKANRAPADSR